MGDRTASTARRRRRRARVADAAGWAVLSVLTVVGVHLGRFWFAGSWLQPTMLAAAAATLAAGALVGAQRAARSGRPLLGETVRYGLLSVLLFASAVGVLLLVWMAIVTTVLGGWVS
jgi:hypothetical protein